MRPLVVLSQALPRGIAVGAIMVLAACTVGAPEAERRTDPVVARGAELYNANCLGCHGGATGGAMMDWPPRHNASGHTWHHPDCQLISVILDGSGEMGEMMRGMMGVPSDAPRMPSFRGKLSEEEVRAILSYIKTWWREDQRHFQARATEQLCPTASRQLADGALG